jgi:multiple sugar transport system permease protein
MSPGASRTGKFTPYVFLIPGAFLFAIFMVYPLADAFRISLLDWKIMPGAVSPFVGADNYARALDDPIFWMSLKNTALYALVTVPAQMALAMLVAVALDSIPKGRVVYRVLFYLPVITSWVVVSLLFRYLFDASEGGIINFLLMALGLAKEPIAWLREPETAMIAIMLLGVWKGIGWSMVIFLAALQTIPPELHEAAEMDGATSARRFFGITLPLMRPTIVFVLVTLIIGGFNVFISIYLITGGGPLHRTESILTYMYDSAFNGLEFGYASALSYILAIIVFIISALQIKFLRSPTEM